MAMEPGIGGLTTLRRMPEPPLDDRDLILQLRLGVTQSPSKKSHFSFVFFFSDAPEKVGSEQRHEAEQSTASFFRGSGAPPWSEGSLGAGCGWLSARAFKIRTARLSQSSGGGPLDLPTILSVRSRVLTCRGLRRGKTAANASSAPYRTPQAANLAPPRLAASSPARISRRTLTAQGIDTGTSTGNSGG